jgi:hypothetical protein
MDFITTQCPHERCGAQIAEVFVSGVPASRSRGFIDPREVSWQDGGRYRLSGHQPHAGQGRYNAALVRAASAFGVKLYALHETTCLGKQQRGRTKAGSS